MIVGAFVGSFATMMGMKTETFNPNAKPTAEVVIEAEVGSKD